MFDLNFDSQNKRLRKVFGPYIPYELLIKNFLA